MKNTGYVFKDLLLYTPYNQLFDGILKNEMILFNLLQVVRFLNKAIKLKLFLVTSKKKNYFLLHVVCKITFTPKTFYRKLKLSQL